MWVFQMFIEISCIIYTRCIDYKYKGLLIIRINNRNFIFF